MSDGLIIPDDLSACQALIGALAQAVGELSNVRRELAAENAELKLALNELLQQAFRRRSERYLEDPQLKLDLGGTDEAADAADGLADAIAQADVIVGAHKRRQKAPQPRSEQLPEHLPRYEVEAEVPQDVKICPQHGARQLIGHDRLETLEFERPRLRVRVTLIPKFACGKAPGCGVAEPPRARGARCQSAAPASRPRSHHWDARAPDSVPASSRLENRVDVTRSEIYTTHQDWIRRTDTLAAR